jgi:osmoprotectant transport system permease protein
VSEQLALLPGFLTAHLQLSLVALGLGTLVSVPLGILVTRRRELEPGVLGVASVIQTIPSLALLAIMVPALAALGTLSVRLLGIEISSIGYLPAIAALTLYSMLPILRNTVAGIEGVDPALVEAARGVGMTPRQQLRRVELPLALPVIVAGLRTATVWVVGTATLSTPVGATSLGNFIFSGLQTRNSSAVLVGCLAAAALAIVLDQTIRLLEVGLRERRRGRILAAAAVLLVLATWTLGAFAYGRLLSGRPPLSIGAKTFTEQYVLSEILAQWIEARAGRRSEALSSLGSTVAFDALRTDQIDLYVDYSGTIWATIMKREGLPEKREEVLEAVRTYLLDEHGIELVAALGFENTYALGVRADRARELGLARISDLPRVASRLAIGGDFEFFSRAEWKALESVYGLAFREQRSMDPSLMYPALEAGDVDVISAYSTDGRIAALGIELLEDDRGVIPPYDAIVLASPRLVREEPEVVAVLRELSDAIAGSQMQRLNHAVDGGGRSPRDAAAGFLAERIGRARN